MPGSQEYISAGEYARMASEWLVDPSTTYFVYEDNLNQWIWATGTIEPSMTTVHRIDPNSIYWDLPRVNWSIATSRAIYDNSFDIRCMSKEAIMDYMIQSWMITEVHK